MTVQAPEWAVPQNLQELVDSSDGGIWEDDRWDPILITVMKDTVYRGREIPLAWQIEFEPDGPAFETANETLSDMGLDPDGYGWATLIASVAAKYHPELNDELQFGDTEESSCVVWVESEASCKTLAEIAWNLIHAHSEAQ